MPSNFRVGGVDTDDIFIRRELFQEGGLWLWGINGSGVLGTNDATTLSRSSPVQTVSRGSNWDKISIGARERYAAGIKTDGTLWIWGNNQYGQLGDNTRIGKSSPVQIAGTNWRQVSCGARETFAIKTDGTLWAWGLNNYGSLGTNNTGIGRSSPVQIAGTNWRQASSGGYFPFSAAIKTDNTLWTWGNNFYGSLGDSGSPSNRSSPVQIAGTNWKTVSCTRSTGTNMGAIKTDGTLWMWGGNQNGQLGDNTTIGRSSPVQIFGGGTNWKQLSIGGTRATAIKNDGTLWLWGSGSLGILGDNNTIHRSSPVQIFGGGTNWKKVEAGSNHFTAIKTDGTLWVWGFNSDGQLGTGDSVSRSSPVQTVAGSTNWREISNGTEVAAGIREDFY